MSKIVRIVLVAGALAGIASVMPITAAASEASGWGIWRSPTWQIIKRHPPFHPHFEFAHPKDHRYRA